MSKRKALNPDLENSSPELVPENIFESPENLELDENLSNSLHNNAFIFNPQNFDNEENPSDFSRDNGFIYNHENLENEDNFGDSIENNAYLFEEIEVDVLNDEEVPPFADPDTVNNDFFFPDHERFSYANKSTPDIWEKVTSLSQLPALDYFINKVGQGHFASPEIHPENTKDLSSPKGSFLDFVMPFIINVLVVPTNNNLRSKGIKRTTSDEILQLFLFELAQVCTAEKHSVMQKTWHQYGETFSEIMGYLVNGRMLIVFNK